MHDLPLGTEPDFIRLCDTIVETADQADALLTCIGLASAALAQAQDRTTLPTALGGVSEVLDRLRMASDLLQDLTKPGCIPSARGVNRSG